MLPRRVAVAYSGGHDSTALLRATLDVARPLGIDVLALHVHHGLSPHADAWWEACETQCRRWARAGWPVAFRGARLADRPGQGESVEAWARRARYEALAEMARTDGASLVLLAHHRRDQAETLLLQALRGAGIAGLAAMPAVTVRDGLTWARPWLAMPRTAIDAYVRRHRLRHIDDDSNDDTRFARNRLRLDVWPALLAAFPQAEGSLADAAAWAQQALVALDELAAIDLSTVAGERGLDLAAWGSLSDARRSLALRTWLSQEGGSPAPASLVARLLADLPAKANARWPLAVGELRSHRGWLTLAHVGSSAEPGPLVEKEASLRVWRAGRYPLPGWRGSLRVRRVAEGGVPLAWLARLDLRPREGGERFQAGLGRPPRSLKRQYQAAGVPAWQRHGPLLFAGGQLVFVPGLGLDARVIGMPGQPQVQMSWEPLDPG